mmetsp:Transcript_107569/g.169808  ORF Transcript_107569/g.169808 Transcript_107569/m.169808 type:complete len:84 (-) Transcript_107569:1150-1401(-)
MFSTMPSQSFQSSLSSSSASQKSFYCFRHLASTATLSPMDQRATRNLVRQCVLRESLKELAVTIKVKGNCGKRNQFDFLRHFE